MKARGNSDGPRNLSIGEVAARFDLATHVLRYWEDEGLLTPRRDASGYRRYGADEIVRIAVILRNQVAGMTLEQIGALLDADRPGRRAVLEEHLRALDERERELERSRMMTEHALRCEAHDIAACPRFSAMVVDVVEGAGPWTIDGPPDEESHVHE
ncbi:MerR family transcriptional regulator [Nostocoides sp. F2B08]|uniref:MerR family transcriptional regulator n=1 Tax=Nostocoides sp. F2B08 TaxID=2653936 RepID=UPI00126358F7|nr:MerR family transcriptional regulator [Tetrasphaera sp. F2B08]KAB7745371.1 MerR family transcriptional regulator [Tetrasphaera sp. F2B08]